MDDEALSAHFEHVEAQREAKYRGDAVPDPDMTRNELTAAFRK